MGRRVEVVDVDGELADSLGGIGVHQRTGGVGGFPRLGPHELRALWELNPRAIIAKPFNPMELGTEFRRCTT